MQSNPADFEYIARLKFATKLRYSTQHAAEGLLSDNYFHNSATQYLKAGDEIDIVCFHDDGSWTKGLIEVKETGARETKVELLGAWRHSGGGNVIRSMSAVHKGFGKLSVLDEAGKEIAKELNKVEAANMAAGREVA